MSSLPSFEEVLRRLPGSDHSLDAVVALAAQACVIAPLEKEIRTLTERLDVVAVLGLHHSLAMIPEGIATKRLPLPARLRALDPLPP